MTTSKELYTQYLQYKQYLSEITNQSIYVLMKDIENAFNTKVCPEYFYEDKTIIIYFDGHSVIIYPYIGVDKYDPDPYFGYLLPSGNYYEFDEGLKYIGNEKIQTDMYKLATILQYSLQLNENQRHICQILAQNYESQRSE